MKDIISRGLKQRLKKKVDRLNKTNQTSNWNKKINGKWWSKMILWTFLFDLIYWLYMVIHDWIFNDEIRSGYENIHSFVKATLTKLSILIIPSQ